MNTLTIEDLRLGRALYGRFLLSGCSALRFHLATIESHRGIVVE